jgi:hypothetical protein
MCSYPIAQLTLSGASRVSAMLGALAPATSPWLKVEGGCPEVAAIKLALRKTQETCIQLIETSVKKA